jgi:hypothetical protein
VTRNRRLFLGCAGVAAAWLAVTLILGGLAGPCNPNDLGGCGAIGEVVLLGQMLVLPAVFLVLVGLLLFSAIDARGRAQRNDDEAE